MEEQNSSLTIINKNNGTLVGEGARAIPVQITTSTKPFKFVIYGMFVMGMIFYFLILFAKTQVLSIETTGVSSEFKEYSIK